MASEAEKRRQKIEKAIHELGGQATIRQIAKKLNLNVNGVSQTLGTMEGRVYYVQGRGGDSVFETAER